MLNAIKTRGVALASARYALVAAALLVACPSTDRDFTDDSPAAAGSGLTDGGTASGAAAGEDGEGGSVATAGGGGQTSGATSTGGSAPVCLLGQSKLGACSLE